MVYKYSTKITEHMAKAVLVADAISTKHSIEICNMIRGLPLSKAKQLLKEVIEMKRAVPFKRFNDNVGHRKGMGPGRYPNKAATKILQLLNSVEANAEVKALDKEILEIKHICAHIASRPMRYGRHRGRVSKRTHVEVVVHESSKLKEKKPKKEKKVETKETHKTEVKKDVKEKVEEKKPKLEEPKVEEKKEVKEKVEEKKPKLEEPKVEEK
ncbi:MAG: 50S ribosomal protein L22, partial [Candidatus Woesearchaeota archaeon]